MTQTALDLAARINQIAVSAPASARFGGRKVYISYICQTMGWSVADMRGTLLALAREGAIQMARQDMGGDRAQVVASEITQDLGFGTICAYHHVIDLSYKGI